MIVDKPGPEGLERQCGEEEQVRWVADVHHFDAGADAYSEREEELGGKRGSVLEQVTEAARPSGPRG